MGKGKNKERVKLKDKSQHSWTVNCSVTARNLRKSDLGGVIFGCKHSTIKECLLKQIFGLPAPHYAYVKNIDPGLPIFLFNYSDRRLHGIFEAVSVGQMNINPHGWTSDGSDTPYAAQVRIKIRMQCPTLQEDQFLPVIENNYYEPQHFWFELDRQQTEKLISLFSCSPATARTSLSNSSENWCTQFKGPSAPKAWEDGDISKKLKSLMLETSKNNGAVKSDHRAVIGLKPSCGLSYSSVVRNISTPDMHPVPSNNGWGSLDEASGLGSESKLLEAATSKSAVENYEVGHGHVNHVRTYSSALCSDQTNMSSSSWDDPPGLDSERQFLEDTVNRNDVESCRLVHEQVNHEKKNSSGGDSWDDLSGWVRESQLLEHTTSDGVEYYKQVSHEQGHDGQTYSSFVESVCNALPQKNGTPLFKTESASIPGSEVEKFETPESEINITDSDQFNMDLKSSRVADGENKLSEIHTVHEVGGKDDESQDFQTATAAVNATHMCVYEHGIHQDECVADCKPSGESTEASEITSEDNLRDCTEMLQEAVMGSEMKPSGLQTIVAKLVEEVKDLKSSQLKQVQKISYLEQELVYSRLEIQKLKKCCKTFKSTCELDEPIFVIGGCDGPSWLSSLDAYSPSLDLVKSLCPMNYVRKHAAAAKLNGELYVFGGVSGDVWYNEVESYNLATNQWIRRPSLNRGKGSLAGITVNGKIFAVGGGDGTQSLSDVEIFDSYIGTWIPVKSMLHKRFAPDAAEINGIIYVAGGYDGKDYLASFERFDPREYSWTRLENMTTKRGCHSLIALNEKLYALGGYNDTAMVPTVEVYDPRMGSWTIGEPMNESRGYFGAVAMRDTIYVLGGLNKNDEILDAVETYKEGHGWQVTGLKGIGKRAFFSAIA